VLLPIFNNIKLGETLEDQMWISTTLIQALRNLVNLFCFFFKKLRFLVDAVLELCVSFLTQDNETLSRLGSDCLVALIEGNVDYMDGEIWDFVVDRLVLLFEVTTPTALYFDATGKSSSGVTPFNTHFSPRPQKKDFQNIITKCVMHLLVIDTLTQLLSGKCQSALYESLSSRHLFKLGDVLFSSYIFAKSFNCDVALRQELHKMGFMKQLPNLLKQETSSVSGYIVILSKMYTDSTRTSMVTEVERRLIPYLLLMKG
jgi:brefeldin A-inhibited guanine nucleotide-exchange protein